MVFQRKVGRVREFLVHLFLQTSQTIHCSHLCSGFADTSPPLREATVKSMVVLAGRLNTNNLNVELMRHLARLQGHDDQPSIRTNTSICLGKIAAHLAPQSRQRILVSAFTRATKDPFPAARMAAVSW